MPVLKQHTNTPAMREAIVLDLGDIGAQAARIRAAAETQAAQILAKAQRKAEEIAMQRGEEAEQLGYKDGLEKGMAEGREQGRAQALSESAEQLRQISAAWSQVATDWEQQRIEMEREARTAVLNFALATAEKLVHRIIEVDETIVVDQVAQALSMVLSAHDAHVRIHPVDRPMLEDAMPELIAELTAVKHIDLVDDEAITPGGCVVTFGQGKVDATIEKQMQRIVDLLVPDPEPIEDEPAPLEESVPEAPTPAASTASPPATPPAQPPMPEGQIAPVYEITEQGLVEAKPKPKAPRPADPVADELDGDDVEDDTLTEATTYDPSLDDAVLDQAAFDAQFDAEFGPDIDDGLGDYEDDNESEA